MGRIPTGRPKGRPKGTGRLGEIERLTVRIPKELYTRFLAFAEGRRYHRGDPQLADSVRDALAHYLACPHKRQTRNGTVSSEYTIQQTDKGTKDRGTTVQQTDNGTKDRGTTVQQTDNETVPSMALERAEPWPLAHDNGQTSKRTESVLEDESGSLQQTQSTPPMVLDTADVADRPLEPVAIAPQTASPLAPGPAFNPLVYWLRPPGACGHASHGAAGNLIKRSTGKCKLCEDVKAAQKKAATRPASVTKEK